VASVEMSRFLEREAPVLKVVIYIQEFRHQYMERVMDMDETQMYGIMDTISIMLFTQKDISLLRSVNTQPFL
jgi:hypothetical protein